MTFNRPFVTADIARFVVVAVPETVRPPAAVPLPIVVDAYDVSPPLNERSVDVAFEGKRYENELPLENERHALLTEKQPLAILMPLANVLVAVVDETLSVETERPPANVEVAVEVAK